MTYVGPSKFYRYGRRTRICRPALSGLQTSHDPTNRLTVVVVGDWPTHLCGHRWDSLMFLLCGPPWWPWGARSCWFSGSAPNW